MSDFCFCLTRCCHGDSQQFQKKCHREQLLDDVTNFPTQAASTQLELRMHAAGTKDHIIRTFLFVSRTHGIPSATLFIDFTSAFYCVIREMVMHLDSSDVHIAWLMRQLEMPDDIMHKIAHKIKAGPILNRLPVDKHLVNLLKHLCKLTPCSRSQHSLRACEMTAYAA